MFQLVEATATKTKQQLDLRDLRKLTAESKKTSKKQKGPLLVPLQQWVKP
jgi:hypothetical protein